MQNLTKRGIIGRNLEYAEVDANFTAIEGAVGALETGKVNTSDPRLTDARAPLAHTQTASSITDLAEFIQDTVASFLGAGSNIAVTYDDANNSFTINASGGGQFDPEATRDAIGAALIGVGNIAVVINDAADTITITTTATQNSTDAFLLNADNHVDGTTKKVYTATEQTLLASHTTQIAGKVDKVVGKGLSTLDYGPADQNKLASLNPKTTAVYGDNVFNKDATDNVLDSYINASGALQAVGSPWKASGFIDIVGGQDYTVNCPLTACAWYDSSKTRIAQFTASAAQEGAYYHVTAPAGGKYARISTTAPFANMVLSVGAIVPASYPSYWKTILGTTGPFAGKDIGFLGNSFIYQGAFFPALQAETKCKSVISIGVNGGVYRSLRDALALTANANKFSTCAAIGIVEGTNEYGHGGNTAGVSTDARDATTVTGAMLDVYLTLRAQYPSIPVFWTTAITRGSYNSEPVPPAANPYGLTLPIVNDVIKAKAALLNTRVCDIAVLAGVNAYNMAEYLPDNLHPANEGANDYGRKVGRWMNREFAY